MFNYLLVLVILGMCNPLYDRVLKQRVFLTVHAKLAIFLFHV